MPIYACDYYVGDSAVRQTQLTADVDKFKNEVCVDKGWVYIGCTRLP